MAWRQIRYQKRNLESVGVWEAEERQNTLPPGKISGLQSGHPPIRNRLACSLHEQYGGTGNSVRTGKREGVRMLQNRSGC